MIGHIKSIKMSGLSDKLSSTIATLRLEEITASRPFRVFSSITSSIAQVPLLLSPVVAFAMFQGVAAKTGQVLDATRLFAALSLIILLAQPLFWMFEVVLDMSAAMGGFARIEKFLTEESRKEYREISVRGDSQVLQVERAEGIELQGLDSSNGASFNNSRRADWAIEVCGASFAWSEEQDLLHNVNFTITEGQLVLLLGPIASGKTTLLKGILGEVPFTTGKVTLTENNLAWCDQTPWLLVSWPPCRGNSSND